MLSPPLVHRTPTAATLAVTYRTSRGRTVILTRRPATMRRHPGQIALPGGMIEPFDSSALSAAIREAREEVGLALAEPLNAIELPQVATLTSEIVIQPYWVEVSGVPRLKPAPDEVAAILRVPLRDLRAPGALKSIQHPRRPTEQTPAFIWRGEIIWGATLRTLRDLLDIVES